MNIKIQSLIYSIIFCANFCFCQQDPLTVNPNTGLIKAALHSSSFNPDHHKGKWSAAAMD